MIVRELIKKLQKCDQNKEVLINSYYIDEDYDWDENLELRYVDDDVISPEISETDIYVYLNWGKNGNK